MNMNIVYLFSKFIDLSVFGSVLFQRYVDSCVIAIDY